MAPIPIIVSPTAGTMRSCAIATSVRTRYATPVTRPRRRMTRQGCGMPSSDLGRRAFRMGEHQHAMTPEVDGARRPRAEALRQTDRPRVLGVDVADQTPPL